MINFFFQSSKFSALFRHEAPSKSLQGFTLCCQLLFSFYHPFITGVLHGVSSWWFIKDLIHSRSVLKILVGRAQIFFFLHSKVQFVLPYHLRWCYVILDNLSSRFMIHMLSRMRYFKSTNLFVGFILCHVSPKAFPKECCYYGAYQWSKFSPILLVKEVFHRLGALTQINGFL